MARWNVTLKSDTTSVLGVVVKEHRNVGTLKNPCWRVWYFIEGTAHNADVRSLLANFLSGGRPYTMTPAGF